MRIKKSFGWTIAVIAALLVSTPTPDAYVLKGTKWNSSPVPFYVNAQNLDVDEASAISAVQFGAHAWTNQTNAAFSFYYAGSTSGSSAVNNGKNEVFFRNASNGSAIATTYTWSSGGRTLDTDIIFWDGGFRFFTGSSGCSAGLYIEDIAAHEFGHALGLGHSTVGGATMAPSVSYCAIDMRYLSEDDKQGVEYLYSSSSASNSPPVASISSPTQGSVEAGTTLTFAGAASDSEDGDIGNSLVWTSSIDGQIGTGKSFQRTLSPGSHVIKARVVDSSGVAAEAQRSLTVESEAPPQSGAFQLFSDAYKLKGLQRVDLTWSGAAASSIDIYRDGAKLRTTLNTGRYSDGINKRGGGTYTYLVCEAGTAVCSNQVTVIF
jgi:hypothetical protein